MLIFLISSIIFHKLIFTTISKCEGLSLEGNLLQSPHTISSWLRIKKMVIKFLFSCNFNELEIIRKINSYIFNNLNNLEDNQVF